MTDIQDIANSVLIQGCTLQDIERMINRAVDARMKEFYDSIKEKPDALIRRTETAKKLNVSLVTLDKYAKFGILHPRHVGGRIFYAESEVEKFLFNNKK
jgi:DNA-binding transcriptional MerR regulator